MDESGKGENLGDSHRLTSFLLGVPLTRHGQLSIHQCSPSRLQVHIIEAGAALSEGEDRQAFLRETITEPADDSCPSITRLSE